MKRKSRKRERKRGGQKANKVGERNIMKMEKGEEREREREERERERERREREGKIGSERVCVIVK